VNSLISIKQVLRFKMNIFVNKMAAGSKLNRSLGHQISDSQRLGYEVLVTKLISSKKRMQNFRRSAGYQLILEHIDLQTGLKYADRIRELNCIDEQSILKIIEKDYLGNPVKYFIDDFQKCSPTTLRYISVASEILSLGVNFDRMNLVEIGSGYGGQARVIDFIAKISSYTIYDLPSVQKLNSFFLQGNGFRSNLKFGNINHLTPENFDFCISNYAFSELPYLVQQEYLEKIICNSTHGYMIMNSGRTNYSGRSAGKISIQELLTNIPNSRILEESPLTGPDNYVLVW